MKLRFHLTIACLFLFAGALLNSQYLLSFLQSEPVAPDTLSSTVEASPATVTNPSTGSGIPSKPVALPPQAGVSPLSSEPKRIEVPRLGISLSILPGYYNYTNHSWTVSNHAAHFASVTALPNTIGGNTFIYGHRRAAVFKNLNKLQTGDVVIITTASGSKFTYSFSGSRGTNPNDVALFGYQGKPILTLQTCAGAFNQDRELFTFNLVKAA